MSTLTVAALQLPLGSADEAENIVAVSMLVEEAAKQGAQVVLPPELFSGPYFCRVEDEALFALARPTRDHPSVRAMQALAAKLKVAIPTSFFERDGHHYYNTLRSRAPTARATFPTARAMRKSTISAPATTGSRCGMRSATKWAWGSAGTSGTPNARG